MSIYFSNIWNTLIYNTEEDPIEAYVIVPQEPCVIENVKPADDLCTPNSPGVETLDTETSNIEITDISKTDSSSERAASNPPDDSQTEAENEQSKTDLIATDTSKFLTRHSTANSPGEETLDTETSNTEKRENSNTDTFTERAASNLPDDSKTETENEQPKFDLVATDTSTFLTRRATDESPDSDGEIPQNKLQSSSEGGQISSSPAEEKLRRKLFVFDTVATIIGWTVPLLAIGIGAENIGNCPADFYIPYLVIIMGILALFIVSYAFLKSSRENFDYWTLLDEDVIFMASTIFVTLWLWKDMRFFAMDPSFNSSENYCNYKFYIFNIYLDVLLGLGFIIGFCLFDLNTKRRPSPSIRADDHWMIFDYSLS